MNGVFVLMQSILRFLKGVDVDSALSSEPNSESSSRSWGSVCVRDGEPFFSILLTGLKAFNFKKSQGRGFA